MGRPVSTTRLVLFAHGSTDARWRAPFEELADGVATAVGADRVRIAWMESSPPTLGDVGDEAAAAGITHLRILPLFMATGVHVRRDIEARAEAVRIAHPHLSVEILPPIGEDPRLVAVMHEVAAEAATAS